TSAKNLVGSFYQPRLVVSDISLLRSLPERQIRSGLAEIIKYGIINDSGLFSYLEDNIAAVKRLEKDVLERIVSRSSAIKARFVQADEYDNKGMRAYLNFGHTIGHALEAACKYSNLYSHGEAIAVGMAAASRIALRSGLLDKISSDRIINLIKEAGLPVTISRRLKVEKIMKAQAYDKKMVRGVNRFVLPVRIGSVKLFENISRNLILDTVRSMRNENRAG
ncbi:MAG: 3-dehydroquinate synthase family protein, partial [Candidatus Omnitrophota bacterium]